MEAHALPEGINPRCQADRWIPDRFGGWQLGEQTVEVFGQPGQPDIGDDQRPVKGVDDNQYGNPRYCGQYGFFPAVFKHQVNEVQAEYRQGIFAGQNGDGKDQAANQQVPQFAVAAYTESHGRHQQTAHHAFG